MGYISVKLLGVTLPLACSRIFLIVLGMVGAAAATTGCGRRVEREQTPTTQATAVREVAATAAPSSQPVPEESCGLMPAGQIRDPEERITRDPKTGRQVTAVGQGLERQAKATTLAQLMKMPEAFAGKQVAVEGDVTAMCSGRRGWYAVTDKSGTVPLRIITAPNFLVPKDAMTKRSRATGVLELSEVNEQAANHLSRAHGLPEARRSITLRATGAEFL